MWEPSTARRHQTGMKTTLLLMIALTMLMACGGGDTADDGTDPETEDTTGIDAFGSDQ